MEFQSSQNKKNTRAFSKKKRAGQICLEQAKAKQIWPRSIRGARETPIQTAGKRDPPVSASGRPNRYAPFLAVRSSHDRWPALVVSATEDEDVVGG
jgi:hypothetical protein